MKWMENRSVVLGVTGGISAYRATDIIRGIVQRGASVNVVMTKAATHFITPLTLQTLSHNPVITELFDLISESRIGHISLAERADLLLVAPATANIIGKFAHGIADDMLSTIFLATEAPVMMAPAMNEKMFENSAVRTNMKMLKERGISFIDPERGELACGDVGYGRLAHVDRILEAVYQQMAPKHLINKKVLVTAGPTREPIDPVRCITNRSSGKMGFSLARAAKILGAEVVLVSGPTMLTGPVEVETIRVNTGEEMYHAVMDNLEGVDMVIKAAAVADFRPKKRHERKVKKQTLNGAIQLEKNIDILRTLGERGNSPYLVGFAAETDDIRENALRKMEEKHIDAIVANDVSAEDTGFSSDYNRGTIFFPDGSEWKIKKMEKIDMALEILSHLSEKMKG